MYEDAISYATRADIKIDSQALQVHQFKTMFENSLAKIELIKEENALHVKSIKELRVLNKEQKIEYERLQSESEHLKEKYEKEKEEAALQLDEVRDKSIKTQ